MDQFQRCSRTTSQTQIPPVSNPQASVTEIGHQLKSEAATTSPEITNITAHSVAGSLLGLGMPGAEHAVDPVELIVVVGIGSTSQGKSFLRRSQATLREILDHSRWICV